MELHFRPHHFLCSLCFRGNGYSNHFVQNYAEIMALLESDSGANTTIAVVDHTDSICSACPHRQEKTCTSQETVVALDVAHQSELGFKPGQRMTWHAAKKQLQEQLTLEKFHRICVGCNWKKYGICENVIQQFLQSCDRLNG